MCSARQQDQRSRYVLPRTITWWRSVSRNLMPRSPWPTSSPTKRNHVWGNCICMAHVQDYHEAGDNWFCRHHQDLAHQPQQPTFLRRLSQWQCWHHQLLLWHQLHPDPCKRSYWSNPKINFVLVNHKYILVVCICDAKMSVPQIGLINLKCHICFLAGGCWRIKKLSTLFLGQLSFQPIIIFVFVFLSLYSNGFGQNTLWEEVLGSIWSID